MEPRWSSYLYRIDYVQIENRHLITVYCDDRYRNEYLLGKIGGLLSMLLYRVALRSREPYELVFEGAMYDLERT